MGLTVRVHQRLTGFSKNLIGSNEINKLGEIRKSLQSKKSCTVKERGFHRIDWY
jgi:hypothetical protein